MQVWFVSDVHLKSEREDNYQSFVAFLEGLSLLKESESLILLGDIFDFWVGPSLFFYRKYSRIVELILALQKKGWLIYYLEGNHDFHVARFWEKRGIITPSEDILYLKTEGMILRVEHGDFINRSDVAYLRYRRIIRAFYIRWLSYLLPGSWINRLGEKLSHHSRQRSSISRRENESELKQMIREYALAAYNHTHYDVIVTGHMHIFDDWSFEKDNKIIHSFNLGSWLARPYRALHWDGKEFHWKLFDQT